MQTQWHRSVNKEVLGTLSRCLLYLSVDTPEISAKLRYVPPEILQQTFHSIKDIKFITWIDITLRQQFFEKLSLMDLVLFSVVKNARPIRLDLHTSMKNIGPFSGMDDLVREFFTQQDAYKPSRKQLLKIPYLLCIVPFGDDHFLDEPEPNSIPESIDLSHYLHEKAKQLQQNVCYELFGVLSYTNCYHITMRDQHRKEWYTYTDSGDRLEAKHAHTKEALPVMLFYRSMDPSLRKMYQPYEKLAQMLFELASNNKLVDVNVCLLAESRSL